MKIGIITHHAAHNYGAMLQAYSLQTYLRLNMEADVKHIHFLTQGGIKAYKIFKKHRRLRGYIWEIFRLFNYRALKKRHFAFESFLSDYIIKTKRYTSYQQLKANLPDFDYYISGSDQVFSPKEKELDTWYLKFCPDNKRKIAYAPSFGYKTIPIEKKKYITKLLNRFDHLSAREISGCNIIKELISKDIPNVLDPVFLLDNSEFKKIEKPLKLKYKKFILCYSLVGMKKQISLAIKIKELTGLPIVLIKHNSLLPIKYVDKIVRYAGPCEFVWLFRNAEYVVTDSFHGTAFSLVFKKNFFSTIAFPEKAERIIGILTEIELENRIIDNPKVINIDNLVIDYSIPNIKLENKIKLSKEYLKMALK